MPDNVTLPGEFARMPHQSVGIDSTKHGFGRASVHGFALSGAAGCNFLAPGIRHDWLALGCRGQVERRIDIIRDRIDERLCQRDAGWVIRFGLPG